MFHIQVKDELFGEDWLECFATMILDAKYESANTAKVFEQLTHLNVQQQKIALSAQRKQKDVQCEVCNFPGCTEDTPELHILWFKKTR
jgi:hypothetical protein